MSIDDQAGADAPVHYNPEPETKPAELEAAIEGEQTAEESPPSEEHEEHDDPPEKPPRGVQKRLNELTREKYEERRRADWLEEMLTQILPRLLPQDQQQDTQSQRNPLEKPDPNQFPAGRYDPDYLEALTDYKVALRFEDQHRQAAQLRQQAELATRQQSFAQQEAEFAKAVPDYQTARESLISIPEIAGHQGIGMAVANAEQPAALIHYLGTHLDEALQIARLDPLGAAMRMGRIEERLGKSATAEPATVSNAPAPVRPIKGAAGTFIPKSSAEARNPDEYARLREKEIAASRR